MEGPIPPPLVPEFQRRVDREKPSRSEYAERSLRDLQALGITSFEQLAASLPSLRGDALTTAIWAIRHFDRRRSVPLLLTVLLGPDPMLRGSAIVGLDMIGGMRAARAFVRHLREDPDPWVREKAAHGLGFLSDSRYDDLAFEPLLDALEKEDEVIAVRAQAAEGLGNMLGYHDRRYRRYRRAQEALLRALDHPAPEMRFWSAFALGVMRSRAALPRLQVLAGTDRSFIAMNWKNEGGRKLGLGWTVGEEAQDAITCVRTGEWPEREWRWEPLPEPGGGCAAPGP